MASSQSYHALKRGGDEDDLMRDVEAFNRGALEASVSKENIVRIGGGKRKSDEVREKEDVDDEGSKLSAVMKRDIVERRIGVAVSGNMAAPKASNNGAASPAVFSVGKGLGGGNKKRSLFAQRMAEKSKESDQVKKPLSGENRSSSIDWGASSRILQGSGLKDSNEVGEIHKENVDRLNSMTVEEIGAARAELVASMSKDHLNFLMRKKIVAPTTVHMDEGGASVEVKREAESKPHPFVPPVPAAFLNIDKVEEEKMEWMSDLPPLPKDVDAAGRPTDGRHAARFDFEGALIPADADVPVTAGLHHHGEEPARAGYTLDELLMLARTTNSQQKAIALKTCAMVVQKHKKGFFDGGVLDQNVIDRLRDYDLVFILRSSLDSSIETLREEALFCLRQLLDNQYDELVLDREYATCYGHIQPSLPTEIVRDKEKREEFNKTREGLKDFEVIKLDMVVGLAQMDLLQRLTYIIRDLNPTQSAATNAVCIARRMARHSLQTAADMVRHPEFLKVVFAKLSDPSADPVVQVEVLKLARVLSAWSRTLASTVLSMHNFAATVSSNMAMESGIVALTLESLRMWDTCLRYGLLTDLFSPLYPLTMKYFVAIRAQLASGLGSDHNVINYDVAAMVFKVTEAFLMTGAQRASEMESLFDIVETCIAAKARDTFSKKDPRVPTFFAASLNLLNTSLMLLAKEEEVAKTIERASSTLERCIVPVFRSEYFSSALLPRCVKQSAILSSVRDGKSRDPDNLPSVGVVAERGAVVPTVEDESPFKVLCPLLMLTHTVMNLNKGLAREEAAVSVVKSQLLEDPAFVNYLNLAAKGGTDTLISNWFATDEHVLLFYTLLLQQRLGGGGAASWNLANRLLRRFHFKHEALARTLFDRVVCNFELLEAEDRLERMGIAAEDAASSASQEAAKAIFESLDEIKSLYQSFIPPGHGNWPLSHAQPSAVDTLTQRNAGETLLPTDWAYLPLLVICNRSSDAPEVEHLTGDQTRRVVLCLRWIYLSLLQQASEQVP